MWIKDDLGGGHWSKYIKCDKINKIHPYFAQYLLSHTQKMYIINWTFWEGD